MASTFPPAPAPPPTAPPRQVTFTAARPQAATSGGWAGPAPARASQRVAAVPAGLGVTLVVLMGAYLVLEGVHYVVQGPFDIVASSMNVNVVATGGLAVAGLLAGLAATVVGLVWVGKAHGALRAAGGRGTPGWAVGCWFIPLANAVLPIFPTLRLVSGFGAARGLAAGWGAAWAFAWLLQVVTVGWALAAGWAQRPATGLVEVAVPPPVLAMAWVAFVVWVVAAAMFAAVVFAVQRGHPGPLRRARPTAPPSA